MTDPLRHLAPMIIAIILLSPSIAGEESQQVWACVSEIGEIAVIDSVAFTVNFRFNLKMGVFPWAIAFTPEGDWAYVVCRDTNNVVVLNTSSLMEKTAVEVGREPFGIEVSADGARAYVTNQADGTVSIIDTSNWAVWATVDVGPLPRGIALSNDGTCAFVCLGGEDRVAVIEVDDGEVVRKIEVGMGPWGVDVTTDDRSLYVSCRDEDRVYAIDLDDDEIVKTIAVNDGPRGVSVIPDAQRVYVPSIEAVAIIDAVENYKMDASGIHGEGWEATVRSDGAFVFVSTVDHEDGIVEVIDVSRMEKIESIWLGEGVKFPRGLAIRPLLTSGRVSTSLTCLGPEDVPFNRTVDISGAISPSLGDRRIVLEYEDPGGSKTTSEVRTDPDGSYRDSFTPERRGTWRVTSRWSGDDEYAGASSPALEIRVGRGGEGSGPLPPIVLIAVILVVLLVVRRRR